MLRDLNWIEVFTRPAFVIWPQQKSVKHLLRCSIHGSSAMPQRSKVDSTEGSRRNSSRSRTESESHGQPGLAAEAALGAFRAVPDGGEGALGRV